MLAYIAVVAPRRQHAAAVAYIADNEPPILLHARYGRGPRLAVINSGSGQRPRRVAVRYLEGTSVVASRLHPRDALAKLR